MKSGKGYTKNLLLAATIVSLSTTMPMNMAYADNPTPTRGAYAAYTITDGTELSHNFTTSDGSTTSYYKTNLSTLNLLNTINGSTAWIEGSQENHNFSVVLPNNETRYFIYGYTKPDGWGDGERQVYNYNGNAAGNSAFYNNRTFNGLNSTVSGGAIYIDGQYQAAQGHGSNLVGTMTADFINNSITNTDTSERGVGGALYIWGPYAGIETLNSNFINNHITYGTAKSGGGALAIGQGWNQGEATVGLINGNFINNYIDAPSSNFGGAIYYEGSSYGEGEITSIGQDPVHTTKFVGNHILGTGQGGAIYAVNKIGSIYADFIGNYIAGLSDNSRGGAISLGSTSNEKNVGSITGDFIGNYITTSANNGTAWGGAIYNNNSVGSITGDFLGNYLVSEQSDTYGGAIYNTGTITNLTSNPIGNYANGKNVYGGAIYNTGTITNLNGKFIENDAYSNVQYGYNAVGGAIANKNNGVIQNISGDFIRNKAHTSYTSNSSMWANGGAIYNDGAKIGTINANFIENEAQREAGAIYNNGNSSDNKGIGTISGNFIKNKVTGEIARDTKGGAISNTGTIDSITNASFVNNTVNSANGKSSYGGAIYNDYMIGQDNGYGYVDSSTGIIDSSFTGNSASTAGGAIYNTADAKSLNIIAKTKAVTFSGNQAANGASIYNLSTEGTSITADGGNITFTNNTPTASEGYGIYSSASVNLAANDGYTVKIDDSINIVNQYADLTINQGNYTGNVELNGKINFENSNSGIRVGFAGMDSGTFKLGQTPANDTYQYLVNAGNYTLDLQNEHAGDNLILSQLSGTATMKLNIDYDATANSMDKITVNAGSGIITLNAVNVINDNEAFVDGTTAEYLDGTARGNVTVISSAINSAVDSGYMYVFTPTATNGELSIARTIAYNGDLINAINDDLGGTIHPTSFSLSQNYTADRAFGNLSTENRESFTIFGNNNKIIGNNKTGINVAAGQTLTLNNVLNFTGTSDNIINNSGTVNIICEYTDYDATSDPSYGAVNNSGTMNITNQFVGGGEDAMYFGDIKNTGTLNITENSRTIGLSNITDDATPTGVINMEGGYLDVDYNLTQKTVYLKGGTLNVGNIIGYKTNNLQADIIVDGSGERSGKLKFAGGLGGSISGTFKGNLAGALDVNTDLSDDFVLNGVNFDSNRGYEYGVFKFANSYATTPGKLVLNNNVFTNNYSIHWNSNPRGGAIANFNNGGITEISNGTFTGNYVTGGTSDYGGAIFQQKGTLSITNSKFTDNYAESTAYSYGGAISLGDIYNMYNNPASANYSITGTISEVSGVKSSTTEFKNNLVKRGSSGYVPSLFGGAIFTTNSSGTFDGVIFDGNKAEVASNISSGNAYGGAIYNSGGTHTINNSIFKNNVATTTSGNSRGGAIYNNDGTHTIKKSVFENNSAITSDGNSRGGAIYQEGGSLTIEDSSFKGNIADFGAAIYAEDVNVTIHAKNADVEFTNNNSTGLAGGSGYGIDLDYVNLNLNADRGRTITINDNLYSQAGMTINSDSNKGTVALNGVIQASTGGKLILDSGVLKLSQTAAGSLAESNRYLTFVANGGTLDIANGAIEDLAFAYSIDNSADSGLVLDVSLGDTNTADKITSNIKGASTIYLSDLNFISDNGNGGEVQIADGNIKSVIAAADVAGGYANVQYDNTTGVLSFADKIAWLEQTNGSQSGYRFTKINNGIMPVNYTSGENNYTFYTDILKKNYVDNNSVAHDLKYTWDNSTHALTVTNSDDTAVAQTTMGITGAGSTANPYVLTGDYTGNNSSLGFARWDRVDSITGDFIGNTKGGIGLGMGITIGDIKGNFIGNTGYSAFAFSGDHSYTTSINSITGDFIGNYNNSGIYDPSGGAIYMFNWNNGGIGTITGDFIGNKADASGGAIALFDCHINSVIGNFVNNYAGDAGGALLVGYGKNGANISVTGDFIANQAVNKGGAVFTGSGSTTKLIDTSFIGNIAPVGAAIYVEKGEVTVTAQNKDIEFTNNNSTGLAGGDGYGIYNISNGYRPLVLNANEGRTLTVNDKVYSESQISINNFYSPDWAPQNGTVIFNNEFTNTGLTEISSNESNAGGGTVIFNGATSLGALNVSGTSTLKLGAGAGTSTFGAVTFTRNPILDLANNSAQTLNVASIKGNSKLNIDLDFTGDSVLGDAINITTGGKTGVLTINDINAITSDTGVIREFTNLSILTGETDGVTLALSESIQQDARFNGDAVETITWEDDYNSSATFDNTVVTSNEYSETKQKHLYVVDGTKLSFDETTTVPKHATGNSNTSDFLKELNTRTDATRTMTAVGAEANTYTVGDNLGATAAGTLNVTGKDSGSTLDMNGKSGFELSNTNTTLALSNLNITNINDMADGGLINITGENSSATLTSVTVGSTTNSAIVNNRTLTLAGNTTINTGIKGTGAINTNGTVALNGALTLGGDTNVQGGTLKLGTGAATSNLKDVVFTNTPTLDLQNSSAQTLTADSISGNAKLNIDIDFTGDSVIADAINITTGGQTGTLTINSIAALASDSDIKEFTNLAILTGETTGVTLALSEAIQSDARFNGEEVESITRTVSDYADTVYVGQFENNEFTTTTYAHKTRKQLSVVDGTKLTYTDTETVPEYVKGTPVKQDVLQALNQSTSAIRNLDSYSTDDVYVLGADLGTTAAGTLNVTGLIGPEAAKPTLNMNGKTGFELTNAGTVLNLSTFNITGILDEETSFLGIADETGTKANLSNITISQAITKDIIDNLGELNFAGTNTINSYIGGTGTTNINGGKTILTQLVQNTVNITAGELEVANIITTNGISNAGTLTLTGTSNANAITGSGSTVIAGNVNNTGSIGQAITVNSSKTLTTNANLIGGAVTNSGTVELTGGALAQTITGGDINITTGAVTSTADKLAGNITNNSTLLLSGTLDKAIAGANGVTSIDSNLKMTSTGSVAGTLALNGCMLDLSGDGVATQYNVDKLNESGQLKIDIDYSGSTPVADSINIATSGGAGAVTLYDITEIGTAPGTFTVEILKGNVGSKTLEISDSLAQRYKGVEETYITYETEDFNANIDFDKTSFDTVEYTEKTQKTLSVVDNVKLQLDKVTTEAKHETGRTHEDSLATLNTTSGSRSMKATTAASSNAYTLTKDLGTTAAGDITVEGRSATDLGTLDMNGKSGFVASNNSTVNLINLNITNAKAEEGSIVNATNSASTTNLDGVAIADNSANVIASNGTTNIQDSTINAGVSNTGTMNLDGNNTIAKVEGSNGTTKVNSGTTTVGSIAQKLINIITGGKLESNGDVTASNGITNNTADGLTVNNGTITGDVTGTGNVKTSGTSTIAEGSTVNQAVSVADGTLTANADSLGGAVTNSGTVDLTGGNLGTSITGGSTTILGNVGVDDTNGTIASAVSVATGAKLTTKADNVTGTINNGGNLELTSGDIQNSITGTGNTTISGAVTNTTSSAIGNDITVTNTGDLTTAANLLGGTVTNSGTVQLDGGTLSQTITGGNISIIDDVDTNAGNLAGATSVASAKELTLTGGELTGNVTGAGTTEIAGTVTNSANISTATNITSGSLDNTNGQLANVTVTSGSLKSNADNVSGTVNNSGTYEITGGTISNVISGTGAVNITDNVINNAVNTTTGAVSVAAGKEFAIGTTGNAFDSASSLTMSNDSTLNLQNNSATTTAINNLVIVSGDNVNVKMDWGDVLNSSSGNIAGTLKITDINLTSTTGVDDTYAFTDLGDKVSLNEPLTLTGITSSTNNFVTFDNATGSMTSYKKSLVRAVDKTDTGLTATYVMTADETAGGEELDGTLKVQGDGHTINTAGIKVGSATKTGADLTLENTNMNVAGKALDIYGGNKATVDASGHDITLTTTDSSEVISLNTSSGAYANAEFKGSNTITVTGDIKSDDVNNVLTIAAGSTVSHAGLLDPITTNVNGTYNRTSGYDETVTYNINAGGQLNFTNDTTLYDASHHTTAMLNTINFNGGTVNTINGVVTDFQLANMSLTGTSNFYADVDLANSTMDKFTIANPVTGTGKLNIAGLNLISDAANVNTSINFTTDPVLMAAVNYTGSQGLTALSPIYKYNVGYDNTTGNFDFARYNTGGYGDYNPAIMAAPVAAQLGGYLTQLNSYDEAFYNMDMYMLMTREQRQSWKLKNKHAAADSGLLYDATLMRQERPEGWFRPFATFERVPLKNGPKVSNVMYGSFMGGESEMYDLGHGWDGMWGAYVGYNGSHQAYNGVSIYQNGGTLGLLGMAYKGNFFTGLTLNAGANGAEANTMYGNEDFSMLMAGIASKTGYNWELLNGKFIIQPSMLMSYSFVNTFDYRNGAGIKMDSDPLHAIQLQPEIKFIGNLKNGWQPYASVAMIWNIMDDTKFKANNVSLPELSVKPFVKYGVGVRKTWGERFTGFFQTYLTNGGRNGVGLQAGFTWVLGGGKDKNSGKKADKQKIQKSLNKLPELKKTEITLNGIKVQ